MIDCKTFLEQYSAYIDNDLSWAEREEMEAHADDCESCTHYDRVVRKGTAVFRSLPELEVSEDFGDRLRWRLYQEDFEQSRARRRAGPAPVVGTLAVVATVAFAAWPLMRSHAPVGRLPAVAATAPAAEAPSLLQRLTPLSVHQEATGLTSRLAQMGVNVEEMPYHDVVFRPRGPLVGRIASYTPPPGDR